MTYSVTQFWFEFKQFGDSEWNADSRHLVFPSKEDYDLDILHTLDEKLWAAEFQIPFVRNRIKDMFVNNYKQLSDLGYLGSVLSKGDLSTQWPSNIQLKIPPHGSNGLSPEHHFCCTSLKQLINFIKLPLSRKLQSNFEEATFYFNNSHHFPSPSRELSFLDLVTSYHDLFYYFHHLETHYARCTSEFLELLMQCFESSFKGLASNLLPIISNYSPNSLAKVRCFIRIII